MWGMAHGFEVRDLETAQHEAAHVVVGARLGLRLEIASLGPWPGCRKTSPDAHALGYASFFEKRGDGTAQAIMLAAGVAWDRALGYDPWHSTFDWQECRKIVRGVQSVEACVTAAAAMIARLGTFHARVTRALLERDITGADLAALCRGEELE